MLYRGDALIPGADTFIHGLQERAIPFLFLTNNSASTPLDYVVKLDKLGIAVENFGDSTGHLELLTVA